ncbi:MAG: bifunctional folylpolyglutamate synthase/dihydrofolate synthase [Proteobacteria bacterium]|nr:bifunctional folylpolyglutamate synthase/dihydrofolate synthase [Pseudomonadota bacterium]
MARALAALGDPQRSLRCVHVAGTNGKGSTAAMLAWALQLAGHRVGLYTSPHLSRFSERMRIDGVEIAAPQLLRLLDRVQGCGLELTFFETLTAIALLWFAEQRVAVAVVEAGLGGRLDATNVVQPEVSVITSIALDHAEVLGATLAQIAGEKAGIIKAGVPAVVAAGAEVEAVFAARCAALGAPHWREGRDFACAADEAGELAYHGLDGSTLQALRLALAGSHQRSNAALALATLELLGERGLAVSADARRAALATVRWPGRMEWIGSQHLLDCAHNPAGARALAAALAPRRDFVVVFSALREKAAAAMLEALRPCTARLVLTRAAVDRAALPAALRDLVGAGEVAANLGAALASLADDPRPRLVTGSSYLVGEARVLLLGEAADAVALADPAQAEPAPQARGASGEPRPLRASRT